MKDQPSFPTLRDLVELLRATAGEYQNKRWISGVTAAEANKIHDLVARHFISFADEFAALAAQGASPQPDLARERAAWEAGFRLCRAYGDNWPHFDGEQKERKWLAYLAASRQEQP